METSFDPTCPKTLPSLSPTPVMLHIKFDQDWPTGIRDIQVESVDDRRWMNDGPLAYYKLTLWALGSGELKNRPPILHLLQAQQAPALPYAKGHPGTGSYPARELSYLDGFASKLSRRHGQACMWSCIIFSKPTCQKMSNVCMTLLFAQNLDRNMIHQSALFQISLLLLVNDSNITSFRDRVLKYLCIIWLFWGKVE